MSRADVRGHSLRTLKWMADGKRTFDYDVAIDQISMLSQFMAGQWRPSLANPYRPLTESKIGDSPESREHEDKLGWKMLERGLGMLCKKRK